MTELAGDSRAENILSEKPYEAKGGPAEGISLCMIVKDEERMIARCLETAAGCADEIIVLDTGSADRTPEIAGSFGAKIYSFKWTEDFSAARNFSISFASHPWILVLDADEALRSDAAEKIRLASRERDAYGYRLIQRTYTSNFSLDGWKPKAVSDPGPDIFSGYVDSPLVRLFRNRAGIRFEGRVHEIVEPSMQRLGLKIEPLDAIIDHYSFKKDSAFLSSKKLHYLRLGQLKASEQPADARAHIDLAKLYIELGSYGEALALLRRTMEIAPEDAQVYFSAGIAYGELNQADLAAENYNKAISLDPSLYGARCNLAAIYYKRGLFGLALEELIEAAKIAPHNCVVRYNLGSVYFARRMPQLAKREFEAALSLNPAMVKARRRIEEIERRCALRGQWSSMDQEPLSIHGGGRSLKAGHSLDISAQEGKTWHKMAAKMGNRDETRITFFYCGRPFCGDTLDRSPLGGTETAIIHIARHLARLGYPVKVFNRCEAPGIYDGVDYRPMAEVHDHLRNNGADVFIAVRYLEPFSAEFGAKVKIFWSGDAPDEPQMDFLASEAIAPNIDKIFAVSRWQAEGLMRKYSIDGDKFFIAPNGVDTNCFSDLSGLKERGRLVYTSTPFRGLDILLELFPAIKAQEPQSELWIYSGMSVYGMGSEKEKRLFGELYSKTRQPGVHLIGSLPQAQLHKELMRSYLFAYPNHFPETSCIAAIEAMAAGLPIVTSKLGALPETVGDAGMLIEGQPGSEPYKSRFVSAVVEILQNNSLWVDLSQKGRKRAFANYDWSLIAESWDIEIERLLSAGGHKDGCGGKKSSSVCPADIGRADDLANSVAFAWEAGDYYGMERLAQKGLREEGANSELWFCLALACSQQGKNYQAKKALAKLLAEQPGHADAAHLLRDLNLKDELANFCAAKASRSFSSGEEDRLKREVELKPHDPATDNLLGQYYSALGRHHDALTEFKKAIYKNLSRWESYENYIRCAARAGLDLAPEDSGLIFYTHGDFDGDSIYNRGIGGAESALIYLSKSIARLGVKVTIYNHCSRPGIYDGVVYRHVVDFYIASYLGELPIVVAYRNPDPFKLGLDARKKIFWAADDADSTYISSEDLASLEVDEFFVLSNWHKVSWAGHFNLHVEKFYIARYGVDPEEFEGINVARNRRKLIYTSRPSRGLGPLLDIFPLIREKKPATELHIFSYTPCSDLRDDEELAPHLDKLNQPGVVLRGSVDKRTLYRELASSYLMVYPCIWRETFCLAALEAHGAGTPAVTSTVAAMPETVADGYSGILISGDPHSEAFKREFARRTIALMDDEAQWQRLSKNGIQRARQAFSWDKIASEWLDRLSIKACLKQGLARCNNF